MFWFLRRAAKPLDGCVERRTALVRAAYQLESKRLCSQADAGIGGPNESYSRESYLHSLRRLPTSRSPRRCTPWLSRVLASSHARAPGSERERYCDDSTDQ